MEHTTGFLNDFIAVAERDSLPVEAIVVYQHGGTVRGYDSARCLDVRIF